MADSGRGQPWPHLALALAGCSQQPLDSGDTFWLGWLGDGARRGMELGAQRVGGDKQREWMGQGLATAAMGAPAMSLAAERRRKMERAGGRMEDALLSKTRRARRGGAHATSELSHAAFGCCTQSAMKPVAQFKFSILPQKFD